MSSFIEVLLRILFTVIVCIVLDVGFDWLQLCFIINIFWEVIIIRNKIK